MMAKGCLRTTMGRLVTLAVQNAALAIVMHYSRVSTTPAESYSPASAVLINEILKGAISFVIAVARARRPSESATSLRPANPIPTSQAFTRIVTEVLSPDCWKLSIPALLYVVQNSLQFVAVSNLPVATFQVTYQMKILTTAAFSVMLLGKRLSSAKWLSLFFLALGVAIVQLQTTSSTHTDAHGTHAPEKHDHPLVHVMHPLKGFSAVAMACFTSGLAGVYFEMVLKGSRADLWVRNVQLSLFSLVPAALPVLYGPNRFSIFHNFGGWAWATVAIQVLGGLVTAVVIKYSDNIMKGFATSLSIVLSFLASVALFDFAITPSFVVGAGTVLSATWMYNRPADAPLPPRVSALAQKAGAGAVVAAATGGRSGPGSPVDKDEPILGQFPAIKRMPSFGAPRAFASALGGGGEKEEFDQMAGTAKYLNAPYGSPFASPYPSRSPSPAPPQNG